MGKRIGTWNYFYENGNLKQRSKYRNGRKFDVWFNLSQAGDTLWKRKFVNDTLFYNLPTK
jgi:antitoxin component YwqK of YwqJK toxin-antitoxin module